MNPEEALRIGAGIEYEAGRTEPPDDFPHLRDIPAGVMSIPASMRSSGTGFGAGLGCTPSTTTRCLTPAASSAGTGRAILSSSFAAPTTRCAASTIPAATAARPVLMDQQGKVRRAFSCKYHGWTYDTEGTSGQRARSPRLRRPRRVMPFPSRSTLRIARRMALHQSRSRGRAACRYPGADVGSSPGVSA